VKTFTDDDIEAVRRSPTPPPPPKKKSANYPIFQKTNKFNKPPGTFSLILHTCNFHM